MAKKLTIFSLLAVLVAFSACGGPETETSSSTTTTTTGGGADTTAPVLTVTAPAAAFTVVTNSAAPASFAVAANATDETALQLIRVLLNGSVEITETSSGTLSGNVDLIAGSNVLVFLAADTALNTSYSTNVVFLEITNAPADPVLDGWDTGTFATALATLEAGAAGTASNGVDVAIHATADGFQHAFNTNNLVSVNAGDMVAVDFWVQGSGNVTGSMAYFNGTETNVKYLSSYATSGSYTHYLGIYEVASTTYDGITTSGTVYGGFELYNGADVYVDQYRFGLVSTLDSANPSVSSIDDVTNGQELSNTGFTVTATAIDDLAVETLYFAVDDGSAAVTNSSGTSSVTFSTADLAALSTGGVTVYVWAVDYVGNTSAVSSVSATLVAGVAVNASDLFISEYIEGGSFNKCFEIYNGTGSDVDLSSYSIAVYMNGSATASSSETLSGTLADGDVLLVGHLHTATNYGIALDITNSSVCNFNGDDAVALLKSDTPIDVVGVIGTDPGSYWSSASCSTQNRTIVRKASITAPTIPGAGFDTLETEWDNYSQDTMTYFGSHTMNGH